MIAIGVGGWFLERPRFGRAVLLGLAVGVAQYLKYNGWLTGVIVAGAAVLGAIRCPEERGGKRILSTFGWGFLGAAIAAALYLPWFRFVDNHGGYSALLAHHRSYLGVEGTWIPYWSQQLAQNVALSWSAERRACFGILALVAAWAATSLPGHRGFGRAQVLILLVGTLASGLAPAGLATLPWWIGLAWCPWLLIDSRPSVRMIGVWWLLLSALTPFYRPYARLWLPLHGAGWILLGGVIASAAWTWLGSQSAALVHDHPTNPQRPSGSCSARSAIALCLVLAGLVVETRGERPVRSLAPGSSSRPSRSATR